MAAGGPHPRQVGEVGARWLAREVPADPERTGEGQDAVSGARCGAAAV